ncbi:hypothetical protein E4656_13610 [Natronospirillum operosum]|uniref:Uncharacterized protein n=1 Tax=Natronospirillum operosum TaxID=2759953 RepID=A0A4Z0WEC3_9GAMM|nr:hypothetical protein [Natronospirillum operosum]TGG92503.1 hypothetical protein E4656_13610 [Natronospirillum operosum]
MTTIISERQCWIDSQYLEGMPERLRARSDRPYMMLEVDTGTDLTLELAYGSAGGTGYDHDFLNMANTHIWYFSRKGRHVARRVARELAGLGFAFLYPGDGPDIFILSARSHLIIDAGYRWQEECA